MDTCMNLNNIQARMQHVCTVIDTYTYKYEGLRELFFQRSVCYLNCICVTMSIPTSCVLYNYNPHHMVHNTAEKIWHDST